MRIAIRADASQRIGSGHLVRCLCLADVLRSRGASVEFVSRHLPDYLRRPILDHGHQVAELPAWDWTRTDPSGDSPTERAWDDALQAQDAEETIAALSDSQSCDWMVVDHYALGSRWESMLRKGRTRLLAIDDLARAHECDALLDQNFYRAPELRYSGRLPHDCTTLLGPTYALLRPEFDELRRGVRARDGEVRRLLVFLGGMDVDNVTERVLGALALVNRTDIHVDVVIGQMHPARTRIESTCAEASQIQCHVQTENMAALLAAADLAVGAGGTNTWERCALGVPTLALCLAENQRQNLLEGSRRGFLYTPDGTNLSSSALAIHLQALLANSGLRNHLSSTGLELVDARGAHRVAALLSGGDISIRRATLNDSSAVHTWRNHPKVRAVSRDSRELALADHQRWFETALRSSDRHILVGERSGSPVGVVRFDTDATDAEVSIYLVPERMGNGEGTALLLAAEGWLSSEHPEITTLHAEVLASNSASQRLFERCSYQRHSTSYAKRLRA